MTRPPVILYWISGPGCTDDILAACGITAALGAQVARCSSPGPHGEEGTMLWWSHAPITPVGREYVPEEQEWLTAKRIGEGETERVFCVGKWREARITPGDLIRPLDQRIEPSSGVTLADHNEWGIPILRMMDGRLALPTTFTLGPDGDIRECVPRRFDKLNDYGAALVDQINAQQAGATTPDSLRAALGREPIDGETLYRIAAEALSVNYRVGLAEVVLLELITSAETQPIVAALTGQLESLRLHQLMEWEKKIGQARLAARLDEEVRTGLDAVVSANGGGMAHPAGVDGP